jgi:hypothetical protein
VLILTVVTTGRKRVRIILVATTPTMVLLPLASTMTNPQTLMMIAVLTPTSVATPMIAKEE